MRVDCASGPASRVTRRPGPGHPPPRGGDSAWAGGLEEPEQQLGAVWGGVAHARLAPPAAQPQCRCAARSGSRPRAPQGTLTHCRPPSPPALLAPPAPPTMLSPAARCIRRPRRPHCSRCWRCLGRAARAEAAACGGMRTDGALAGRSAGPRRAPQGTLTHLRLPTGPYPAAAAARRSRGHEATGGRA